jgi:hypothetical protein
MQLGNIDFLLCFGSTYNNISIRLAAALQKLSSALSYQLYLTFTETKSFISTLYYNALPYR